MFRREFLWYFSEVNAYHLFSCSSCYSCHIFWSSLGFLLSRHHRLTHAMFASTKLARVSTQAELVRFYQTFPYLHQIEKEMWFCRTISTLINTECLHHCLLLSGFLKTSTQTIIIAIIIISVYYYYILFSLRYGICIGEVCD